MLNGRRACVIPIRSFTRSTSVSTNTACRSPASSGLDRLALGRGPVWFGDGRYLCGATFPTTACCAGTRKPARSACSASRRTTPTATPATGRAGSSPASISAAASPAPNMTAHHRDLRPLRGQAAEFAERRGGEIGRLDLVHRSALRHPEQLRGRDCRAELPMNVYRVDGKTGAVTVVADDINAPNGLAFRRTRRNSTSWNRAASRAAF